VIVTKKNPKTATYRSLPKDRARARVIPVTQRVVEREFNPKVTDRYDSLFVYYSNKSDLLHLWVWFKAQAYQESLMNPEAVSRSGAKGLTQFMPKTWAWWWKDVLKEDSYANDWKNPEKSIKAQVTYMKYLLNKFDNNLELALAAYNWGETRVKEYGEDWKTHAPKETKDYVIRINKHYERFINELMER